MGGGGFLWIWGCMMCLVAIRPILLGLFSRVTCSHSRKKVSYKNIMWDEKEKRVSVLTYLPIMLARAKEFISYSFDLGYQYRSSKMIFMGRTYIKKA